MPHNTSLVLQAPGRLSIEHDRPVESPAHGSVLIRVAACGICGSDIPRAFAPEGAYRYPLVLGHEFSGLVAEDAGHFRAGDRVAVFPLLPKPGQKAYATGDFAQTTNYDYFGSRRDGGMQTYLRVPPENLLRLPSHVTLLHAACTEPAAVALHAVRKLHIGPGDTGLVIGAGPIGNLAAQWLATNGCRRVIVSDIDPQKLAVAARMGFEVINAAQTDPVAEVMNLTGGDGAHRVIEACGLPVTCQQALACAAPFGEVVFLGNLHGEFRLGEREFSQVLRRELTIYGSWNSKFVSTGVDDWRAALAYIDRELQIGPLVTDRPSLEEGPAIFASIKNRTRYHNKVIFRIASELQD
jgi:L-iditol 2-dehydrogenase/galactitol-1-phosphate 5-dehydrogenase